MAKGVYTRGPVVLARFSGSTTAGSTLRVPEAGLAKRVAERTSIRVTTDRLRRNEELLGKEGQARIRATTVALVGAGGNGTHAAQQLAYLGVGGLDLIEGGALKTDSRNRYVTAWHSDPIPGTRKVDVARRLVALIDPTIRVRVIDEYMPSRAGFDAVKAADVLFGCVDHDGPRSLLNELAAAYERPYFDLATDVESLDPLRFGGRVCIAWDGKGCLSCMGELDTADVQRYFADPRAREDHERIYGVPLGALDQSGPSVVSVNGTVASLAITEFMLGVAGIRRPKTLLKYYARDGRVTVSADMPASHCYYCTGLRGFGDRAQIERYLG